MPQIVQLGGVVLRGFLAPCNFQVAPVWAASPISRISQEFGRARWSAEPSSDHESGSPTEVVAGVGGQANWELVSILKSPGEVVSV